MLDGQVPEEDEVEEQEGRGESPVDVAGVVNGSGLAAAVRYCEEGNNSDIQVSKDCHKLTQLRFTFDRFDSEHAASTHLFITCYSTIVIKPLPLVAMLLCSRKAQTYTQTWQVRR